MREKIEKRLIQLSLNINRICNKLDNSYLSYTITKQIIRLSTGAALNYGEAQAAESKKDFIHKISIVLKELRETKISLILIEDIAKESLKKEVSICLNECDQLVAIFHKTVSTAKSKLKMEHG